jgi:cell division protease FtsH
MSSTFRTVLLWFVLVAVIFLAWHFARFERRDEAVAFSQLLGFVDAGEVRSLQVELRGSGPAAVFRANLTDGRRVRADGIYSDAVHETLRAADVPFVVRGGDAPGWANVLLSWAPFLLLIGFWLFFMSRYKAGGTNLETARKAVAARLDRQEPRVAAANLSGRAAAALAELRDIVKAEPRAAVLLTGASGDGKSHLLRALASDSASPCLLADGPSFAELFLGLAAARVRDLFAEGRKQRAAFVAIDGLDDICHRRTLDSRGDRDERTQAMMQLCSSLDELAMRTAEPKSLLGRLRGGSAPTFAFIGVTNRPDLLDPAALRRFARVVTLGPPDPQERVSILADLLKAAGAGGDIDVNALASRSEGWTRGDLRSCVDDAVRAAAGTAPSATHLAAAIAAREGVVGLVRQSLGDRAPQQ